MYRLLAKIIEIKETGERKIDGFRIKTLSLKLRIKETIPKIKFPPRIKGRVLWVTRDYPHPYEPKLKDEIIIYSDEMRKNDTHRDGYPVVTLKNRWITVTILPHLGARISSIIYKKRDYFQPKIVHQEKEWVDVGGALDLLDGNLPGNLWNAEFEIKSKSRTGCTLSYNKKGLSIKKEFHLHTAFPLVSEKIGIEVQKKKDITYCKYLPIAIKERNGEIFVPTREKLQHKVYQDPLTFTPWRASEYYGVKFGSFLITDDKSCFLYTTGPKNMEFIKAKESPESFAIYSLSQKKELKKGKGFSYRCVYAVGDEYKITESLIVIKADTETRESFLVRGDERFDGKLRWMGKYVELKPLEIKDVGRLWVF